MLINSVLPVQRFIYNPPRICSVRKRRNGGSATSYPPGIWFFGIRLDFDISPRSNRYHYRNRYKQRFTGLLYCTCIHSCRRVSATQYVVDPECFLQKNVGYSSWVLEYQIAWASGIEMLERFRFEIWFVSKNMPVRPNPDSLRTLTLEVVIGYSYSLEVT